MKKSNEILNKIENLKSYIANLYDEGKTKEAHDKLEELNKLRNEYEILQGLEKKEIQDTIDNGETFKNTKDIDVNKVFNKLVMGSKVTQEEYTAYENAVGTPGQAEHTAEKGGYLVPEEQGKTLKEFRRFEVSLKSYCNVVPVTTMSGKFPVATKQDGKLINFEELNEIEQSELTFAQQAWSVKDYGDIIPVSNTLLEDTVLPLTSIIGKNFTKKAVNTENAEILKILKTVKTKVTGKNYNDIVTVLNVKLDPAIANVAIIVTNQSGFDYLDKLEDKNGRPLLTDSLTKPGTKLFKGKEVVVVTDELLPLDASKYPFYVGSVSDFINFYDRKGVEIAKSSEAGFTKNATLLRAIERFDVKVVDAEAVIYVTIPVVTA